MFGRATLNPEARTEMIPAYQKNFLLKCSIASWTRCRTFVLNRFPKEKLLFH